MLLAESIKKAIQVSALVMKHIFSCLPVIVTINYVDSLVDGLAGHRQGWINLRVLDGDDYLELMPISSLPPRARPSKPCLS